MNMKINRLLSFILFSMLAACGGGGGGGGGGAEQMPAATQCTPATVRIQLFGDSTQWGYLPGGGGARAPIYPELALQHAMNIRYGRGAVIVSTRAVSGTHSGQLLAGTDTLNKPWPQSVDADIVVINHGINDVAYRISPEVYRENLRKLAVAPARIVFETPLPVWGAAVSYDGIMREVAAETGATVADARASANALPDWWQFATDGVHMTSEGNSYIIETALAPALVPLVSKLRCE